MADITSLSDFINLITGGNNGTPERINFYKDGRVGGGAAIAPVAGRMVSMWEYNGSPSHGAVPTTVENPDNTTPGGLRQTNPGGVRIKRLVSLFANVTQPGTLVIYDRLLHIGGLSGTVTTAQTVGGSLTRYTNGTDLEGANQVWIEIYTIIGTTGTTISMSYTDQDNNSGITSPTTAIGNTGLREAQRIIQMPLAAGDTGVRAVASVTLAGTTGTAGNFGVNIVRPLVTVSIGGGSIGVPRDFLTDIPALPEIKTDACLALAWVPNGTVIPQIPHGFIQFLEK